jgi:hypothetical protein
VPSPDRGTRLWYQIDKPGQRHPIATPNLRLLKRLFLLYKLSIHNPFAAAFDASATQSLTITGNLPRSGVIVAKTRHYTASIRRERIGKIQFDRE